MGLTIGRAEHGFKKLGMRWLEFAPGQPEVRTHEGGGGSFVAVGERVVFDDAVSISAGLGLVGRIQLDSGERLERLRERGLQKPLVTYAVDSAKSSNHGRMYCESLVFGDGSEAHFASAPSSRRTRP